MVSYVLIMQCEEGFTTKVGAIGELKFQKGFYYYVGSANSGVHRIRRHFMSEKRRRWHIDYISSKLDVIAAVMLEEPECSLAKKIGEKFQPIMGFGSSDCSCNSHLFYSSILNLDFLSA